MEIIVSIAINRMCDGQSSSAIQNHGYSVSAVATVVCPVIPFEGDDV